MEGGSMKSTLLLEARAAANTLAECEAVAARFGLSKAWAWHVWQGKQRKQQQLKRKV
jgi:hypothetical protein